MLALARRRSAGKRFPEGESAVNLRAAPLLHPLRPRPSPKRSSARLRSTPWGIDRLPLQCPRCPTRIPGSIPYADLLELLAAGIARGDPRRLCLPRTGRRPRRPALRGTTAGSPHRARRMRFLIDASFGFVLWCRTPTPLARFAVAWPTIQNAFDSGRASWNCDENTVATPFLLRRKFCRACGQPVGH